MPRVYLDWNATAPPLPEVYEAMARAARVSWGNPASVHAVGREARSVLEGAREAVAALADRDPRDVVFTSGGTEANNLAIRSAFAAMGTLVTSRLEHPSVTRVAEALEREGVARIRWVRVRPDGLVDLEDLERALSSDDVRLVALQAVNAETGVIQPVAEAIVASRRAGARIHVDAVQAFGRLRDTARDADTRSLAGHKIRGPKSIGALIAGPGVSLAPVLHGGAQERGARPGTVDAIAAAGLEVAARHAAHSPPAWDRLAGLRDALEAALVRLVPGARVNGATAPRMPHVTNIAFPGWSGPELVAALDLEGVAASAGSACSAGTAEPSPVLVAMGDREAASSSVRFSLGEDTTEADVATAIDAGRRVLTR
jgi:cysteine desulfurase